MIQRGNVIEFKDKNQLACGVVLFASEKSVRVLTSKQRDFKVPIDKILHYSLGFSVDTEKDVIASNLAKVETTREKLKNEVQLRLLWDIVHDDESVKTIEELAILYFGKEASDDEIAALTRALYEDLGYFRPRGDGFFPVDEKNVEAMELGRKQQEAHKAKEERFVTWLQMLERELSKPPPDSEKFLEILKHYLIFGENNAKANAAQDLMKKGKIGDLETLFKILEQVGIIQEDENLLLQKHSIPQNFSEKLKTLAIEIAQQKLSFAHRTDLSALHTFTIDDESTTDIDDAISFETLPEGYRVGVHIADPAEFVEKDSSLDKEAHTRSVTLYLPDERLNMLPESIADAASLVKGERRPALSLLFTFNNNGQLLHWEMRETIIEVKERLSYDEVEQRLEEDPILLKLYELALQWQEERIKFGALIINFPRIEIKVNSQTKEITLTKARPQSKSQILVSEWMIFTNRFAANFCLQNNIPAIYRTQQAPGKILSFSENDWVSLFRQRRHLRKGEATTKASPHHGLGLQAYVQMTSPIRRYSDLVMHRQFKATLRNESLPYQEEDLKGILAYSERWIDVADLVERDTKKYWLLKYLQTKIGCKYDAIVLEANLNDYLLYLPELALEVPCTRSIKNYTEGDSLEVTIELIKPRMGIIKVAPC